MNEILKKIDDGIAIDEEEFFKFIKEGELYFSSASETYRGYSYIRIIKFNNRYFYTAYKEYDNGFISIRDNPIEVHRVDYERVIKTKMTDWRDINDRIIYQYER